MKVVSDNSICPDGKPVSCLGRSLTSSTPSGAFSCGRRVRIPSPASLFPSIFQGILTLALCVVPLCPSAPAVADNGKGYAMSSCQPSTTEVSRLLISELERRNRRERTTRTLRSTYTCFASTFGNQPLDSITEPQLSDCLDSHAWQPRTQRNHLAAISQLYRYAIRHAWATANVASSMLPPVIECAE